MCFLLQSLPIEVERITHSSSSPSIHHSRHLPAFTRFVVSRISQKVFCESANQPAAGLVRAMTRAVFVGSAFLQLGPARPITLQHRVFHKLFLETDFGTAYNLVLALAGKPNWRGTGDLAASKAEVKY